MYFILFIFCYFFLYINYSILFFLIGGSYQVVEEKVGQIGKAVSEAPM